MTQKRSLIAVSMIWAGISVGAYFLGQSTSQSSSGHDTAASATSSARAKALSGADAARAEMGDRSVAGWALREMRERGPAASLQRIFSINDPLRRGDALRRLLDEMPAKDFTAFIDAFRQGGYADENRSDYRMALFAWAQKDPITALAYAEENTSGRGTRQTLLAAWAQYDVAGAESWALANHQGNEANPWLIGVIEGAVSSDFDTATRLLTSLPYSDVRGEALNAMMSTIAKLDFEQTVDWLNSIEDDQLKAGATRRIAGRLGSSDPEQAVKLIDQLPEGDLKTQAISEVAESWVREDLDGSLGYVNQLPRETQLSIAREYARDLGRKDFQQANLWLDSLGDDPRVGQAKLRLGWTSLRTDNREQAVELFRELAASDSEVSNLAKRTLRRIERNNPNQAP